MLAAHQHARAVRASGDKLGVLGSRLSQQSLQRLLVIEQRIAPCQQEAVWADVIEIQQQFARLDAVHTQPPALDNSLFFQPGKCLESPFASKSFRLSGLKVNKQNS